MKNITNNIFSITQLLQNNDQIDKSWFNFIKTEITKKYFINLEEKISTAYHQKITYPKFNNIFKYLRLPVEEIKVICLGQDPYHGKDQATGIAFSSNDQIPPPPSLRNILKELTNDLGILKINNSLDSWLEQGFFLINKIATVESKKPLSHQNIGWEIWFNNLIDYIDNNNEKPIVYLLWGNVAQKSIVKIKSNNRLIIKTSHPSPLSSYRSFFNSKPFSQINNFLIFHGIKPINFDC